MKAKEKLLVGAGYGVLTAGLIGSIWWTSGRLDAAQNELEEVRKQQATQIEAVYDKVDEVNSDFTEKWEAQQEQLDNQQEQLGAQKAVQHNTIQALIRTQKQLAENDTEIEELRDEIKK